MAAPARRTGDAKANPFQAKSMAFLAKMQAAQAAARATNRATFDEGTGAVVMHA